MKLKLLFAMLIVSGGLLMAQDTIRTLVITEAKMDRAEQSYVEITNMGTEALNLSDFEFGRISPWDGQPNPWPETPGTRNNDATVERLPDVVLAPGESYVIAAVADYVEEAYARDVAKFGYSRDWSRYITKPDMWRLVDLPVHIVESPIGDPTDSVSRSTVAHLNYWSLMETWGGRDVWYIRHHSSPTDSAVIDQVGGLFTDADGTNPDGGMVDVAGVDGATGNHYLMRRFDVKKGNTTFVTGADLENSEWIPIPFLGTDQYQERFRSAFWTVGNHVNAVLDETTLVAIPGSVISVNWAEKTIDVPWGVRNRDSIMFQFQFTPGLAWHYDFAPSHEDSAYSSVRTGDVLTVYACGNTLTTEAFTLEAMAPTASENRVVPKYFMNQTGRNAGNYVNAGIPYIVSDKVPGMDTISEVPFACRVDSLYKYLEFPPNATSWEIVWVDDMERTDLKNGDLLRVTAENGTHKDYFLKLQKYRESRNADLSSIRWPDIPAMYKDLFGWKGDTIPGFASGVQDYVLQLQPGMKMPQLVAKNSDDNARHVVTRAVSLQGSIADRTVTFLSVAEDDTTTKSYAVTLEPPADPDNVQPWLGEPFISQFVWQDQWASSFIEVVNPGTEPLDLSQYMFYFGYTVDPSEAITGNSGTGDFDGRYHKYIPGRIWVDTVTWAANPGTCIQDLNVDPLVYPKDVFVIGDIWSTGQAYDGAGYGSNPWPAEEACDINFGWGASAGKYPCPWDSPPNAWTSLRQWDGGHYYLYKIVGEGGDSVRNGTKPANDPNDFLLIDIFGASTTQRPVVGGETMQQTTGYTRKAHIYKGNTTFGDLPGGSFGTDKTSSEWIKVDRPYFNSIGVGWALDILRICDGLGSHFMDPVTVGISTVASYKLKVSLGYTLDEEILGAKTGTTVTQFMEKVIKKHPDQTLMVKSGGVEITGAAALTNGDSLVVKSADGSNTTRYFIEVTADGTLSDDAVLTSTKYTINLDPPTVGGFEIGELLADVVDGVDVPTGADMDIIDAHGAYVPTQTINFDTIPVNVLASSAVYFEVMAEDGETVITYQLMPDGSSSDAYVTSAVFNVDQDALLISLVPEGTNVLAFFANLVPANGASWVLFDKLGHERSEGVVVMDDKLVVTAADGVTTKTYYLALLDVVPNYLAYVISDVYLVDQSNLSITVTGLSGVLPVTDFVGNLDAAVGASMEVQDESGTPKTGTDALAEEDVLEVTAGNGVNVVTYSIELIYVGVNDLSGRGLRIYPNPATGLFYVEGAEPGARIRVYNPVGVMLQETLVSGTEVISLEDQPNGMYFITISNGDKVLTHYKLIKQ